MRSNELRDDGASLTTLEDFAPIVLCFYGICLFMAFVSCAALLARGTSIGLGLLRRQKIDTLATRRPAVTATDHVSGYAGCQKELLDDL